MRLSRSSHKKRDPAMPNQVGARHPALPTCVDPKVEVVPTPLFPLVGPAKQRGPYHHPRPPAPRPPAVRCPVHVLRHAPPTNPVSHGLRGENLKRATPPFPELGAAGGAPLLRSGCCGCCCGCEREGAFLISAREPLTSAFDSARVPTIGGWGPVPFSTTSCRQPLSPQYRILLRLHKPQVP